MADFREVLLVHIEKMRHHRLHRRLGIVVGRHGDDAAKDLERAAVPIERLRVEAARQLLSESGLPVKRISQRCGFGSEETMRRSFVRLLAVTPQEYRARFS
jgi:helix-turn-helix protein